MWTYRFFISCCLGLCEEGSVSLKLLLGELPGVWLMIVVSLWAKQPQSQTLKPLFHRRWSQPTIHLCCTATHNYSRF